MTSYAFVTSLHSPHCREVCEKHFNDDDIARVTAFYKESTGETLIAKLKKPRLKEAILTSRFEATRGLFWDGPRNFEPLSDDEDDTRAVTPSPNFQATSTGGRLPTTSDLACNTTDLQWNRVSNLEPSGPKAETLSLCHRDLEALGEEEKSGSGVAYLRILLWFGLRSLFIGSQRHVTSLASE
ncbi:hypothetical protein AVEN_261977-1 [Araneus ventricosus]|uniref:Uncharacterized protein n=1 Tax=Araneus ventricosus TaxID=182803 RepID=A0A4Y2SZ63_ARAVE|nr:hypothetical protein AVEN_261977-1 [Araneus ventricosus]